MSATDLFEPEAVESFDKEFQLQASIAISLKRIADALTSPNEFGEVGSEAIYGAIKRGLREAP